MRSVQAGANTHGSTKVRRERTPWVHAGGTGLWQALILAVVPSHAARLFLLLERGGRGTQLGAHARARCTPQEKARAGRDQLCGGQAIGARARAWAGYLVTAIGWLA